MKKILLSVLSVFMTAFAFAQQSPNVVVSILPPSAFAGNLTHSYATADLDWGVGDLEDPANAVLAELVVARSEGSLNGDGLSNDSCGCEPMTNVDEIAGKIAVVYRGDCQFGLKAIYAQNAGAVAVMIVSRLGEDLINMLGGDSGMSVTIPTVFTLGDQVINLRPEIDAGGLMAFIGNKTGLFDNDLGTNNALIFRPQYFSQAKSMAMDPGDYPIKMGLAVINFGTNDQTGVVLNGIITKESDELYNFSTEVPVDIASGDTVFMDLPDFNGEPLDEGFYEINYQITSDADDEFPSDNVIGTDFMISKSQLTYASVDPETGEVNGRSYYRPSNATDEIHSCIHYMHNKAGEIVKAEGLTFSFTTNGESMIGELINVIAYEWESEFTDINDPNMLLDDNAISELASGEYEYTDDAMEGVNVYAAFDNVVEMEAGIRYLFCVNYNSEFLFSGHDAPSMDYNINLNYYLQPMFPVGDADGSPPWNVFGFGTDIVPAIAVKMPVVDGVEELDRVDITPYPNPAANELNIPVGNNYGETLIDIFDITGKKVKSLKVTTTSFEVLRVDISDLDNGAYIFKMNFENGSFSNFNVVVNNR